MFYGYENSPIMPSMNVYDTSLMQAYIAGARELYNQAKADYKDFIKQYGDFYSPIDADNKRFYDLTMGTANRLIDQYGSDIYRSKEGQAAIEQMIRGVDLAELAKMRASAKNAELYLARKAELQAKGLFDQGLEDFRLNGADLSRWDSTRDGVWLDQSPVMNQDFNQLTSHYYDQLVRDQYLGKSKIPGYVIKGVDPDAIEAITNQAVSGLLNTIPGQYAFRKALDRIAIEHPEYSAEQVKAAAMDELKAQTKNANYERWQPKDELDSYDLTMNKPVGRTSYSSSRSNGGGNKNAPKYFSPAQSIYDTFLNNLTGGTVADIEDFSAWITDKKRLQKGTKWLNTSITDLTPSYVAGTMPGLVVKETGRYKFSFTEKLRDKNGNEMSASERSQILLDHQDKKIGYVPTGRIKGVVQNGIIRLYSELRSVDLTKGKNKSYTPKTIFVGTNIKSNNVSSGQHTKIVTTASTQVYDRAVAKQLGISADNKTHSDLNDEGDFYETNITESEDD